jgi:ectoine hydroxylase-related dioxygenase (phytanoyl-CoA dioxygenase family)
METLFKNNEYNKQFSEKGYVVVALTDITLLEKTINVFDVHSNVDLGKLEGYQNNNSGVSFHSTFLDYNKNYKKSVADYLYPLFSHVISYFLQDYKIIQLNVFNKLPNSGFVSPHQNLTTVDEDNFTSLSIWIPLQDTNEQNGCLYFAPSSNKKFEKYRNPYIYWPPLKTSPNIDDYHMLPVPLKFGEALIFDDSIVHASPDNLSDKPRLSFHCLAIPTLSTPVYPKKVNDTVIELIEVDDDFWFYYTPGDVEPEGKAIKRIPYKERLYSKEDLYNY